VAGAIVDWDNNNVPFCNTTADPSGFIDADDCQTLGDYGSRVSDDGVSFWVQDAQGSVVTTLTYGGITYSPVLVLFAGEYCTGPWREYAATDSTYPITGATTIDNFRSSRIYLKNLQGTEAVEGLLGIKLVVFPNNDMWPHDETVCIEGSFSSSGGKFPYYPFSEGDYGCVSSDDRISGFDGESGYWYGASKYEELANNGYGCLDFAGCFICNVDGQEDECSNNPQCGNFSYADYCTGSTVSNLVAYPLGSFFFNLYFTTKGSKYFGDSATADDGSTYKVCEVGYPENDKYANLCVEARFYDCGDDWANCNSQSCPEDIDASSIGLYYSTRPVSITEELCKDGLTRGRCFNTNGQAADPDSEVQCEPMIKNYWQDDDWVQVPGDAYPLTITCWRTAVVQCP